MIKALTLLLTSSIALAELDVPQFNNTICPAYWELQDAEKMKAFDINKFVGGTYYELAFHDRTQYPTCAKVSCVRSVKNWVPDVGDGKQQILDSFTLGCFGHPYTYPLYFNVTENNGFFNGFVKDPPWWWKIFEPGSFYPDTVVDYQVNPETGEYDWVIEFQCRQGERLGKPHVDFVGINYYAKKKVMTDEEYDAYIAAGVARGLGFYQNEGFGLTKLDQSHCEYEDEVTDN